MLKMKQRLRTESVWVMGGLDERERAGLIILDICIRWIISMNSVLEEFRERRFEVFQDV